MIKDLLGFLNGTIIEENRTCSKVILSNGKSYNSRLFHQSLGIVRILLNKESSSPEQEMFSAEVEKRKTGLGLLREKKRKELEAKFNVDDVTFLIENPVKIGFGKYKGQFSNEVKDKPYFQWALSVRELEKIS